jgi:predicted ribosomally synthesized peptide with nif11-like leader
MNGEEMKNKLEALVGNEAFLADLQKAESKDDLQNVMKKYGVELTKEEVDAFASEIEKILSSEEMQDNDLEQVSGGVIGPWQIITFTYSVGKDFWKKCWSWGKQFANWEDGKR